LIDKRILEAAVMAASLFAPYAVTGIGPFGVLCRRTDEVVTRAPEVRFVSKPSEIRVTTEANSRTIGRKLRDPAKPSRNVFPR
jgi:hydroxymethylglutaryl-CoA reductase